MKKCRICNKEIPKRVGKKGGWQVNCSYECKLESLKRWNATVIKKRCRICSDYFETKKGFQSQRKHCLACIRELGSIAKRGKKNPNWIGGKEFHKKPVYSLRMRRHNFVCQQFRKVFIEERDFAYCEVCETSNYPIFDTHHIYYASRQPNNEFLHHPKNLILVCRVCHKKFHSGEYKDTFEKIEKERGLKALFASGKRVKDPKVFNYRTVTARHQNKDLSRKKDKLGRFTK